MTNLLPDLSVLRHKREIRAYGVRRSGNHAILNWICANAMDEGLSVCFLNDVNHNFPLGEKMLTGVSLPSAPPDRQVDLRDGPDLVIASFEEEFALDKAVSLETGRLDYELIWIRRDPIEVWASRLARIEKLKTVSRKGQQWEFDMIAQRSDGQFRLLDIWDSYHPVPKKAIIIHYELWNSSSVYRKHLAQRLKIGVKDKGKNQVSGWGFGPSFNAPPSEGELRYPQFSEHPLMVEFIKQLTLDN